MKIKYWTVQFRPHPVGLTVYGIAVVAHDPVTGKFAYKKVTNQTLNIPKHQGQESAQSLLDVFLGSIDALQAQSNTLEISERLDLGAYLNWSSRNFNNALLVEGPFDVEDSSLEAALDLLWRFLLEPQRIEGSRKKKSIVKETALCEYRKKPLLAEKVYAKARLKSSGREKKMDIVVSDSDNVYELGSAFNFNATPDANKQNATDSWTYRISELRRRGGRLSLLGKEDSIEVRSDVPVVALYYPPNEGREREYFEECKKDWKRLEVEAIPIKKVASHADALAQRLAG
ncbi:hypothetical protein QPX48_09350 [Corynebacterium accolens]|uniref:hypothetical protein n=1 Tax=Corynebacterium accolens TaxID=38284 RepID=UPI002543780D|nr:hypothetical protein [Corynebacterium accolens]MDK4311976.1 hypothetical protein [Corynebacterium accolens]